MFLSFLYGTHSPSPLETNQKLINEILLKVNHRFRLSNIFYLELQKQIYYNNAVFLKKQIFRRGELYYEKNL